jgi:uncharacterized membrane protein YhaH (DUF805 family)
MQFQDAIRSGFRNYVGFSGRAPRSEFWYWQLFVVLVAVAASILDSGFLPESDVGPISAVTSLVLLLPGIAMAIRRLHDIDRTGWWVLLALTLIGAILLIVWACFKGTDGSNRFGPDPLAGVP